MEHQSELIKQLMSLLIPEELIDNFEISKLIKRKSYYELRIEEREYLIPQALKEKEVVLDGFCNPIELQSFPIKGRAFYIKVYRRRWKEKGSNIHYSNKYDLHYEGMKSTKEFGNFLKEAFGYTPAEYNDIRSNTMH